MSEILTLEYNLAELPSSQHRAGLAGLVLMMRWLKNEPDKKGICEIAALDETSATFRIDQEGLQSLFDKVYAATKEEIEREAKLKNKAKEEIPPLREETRNITDPKTGKSKEKTFYIYPQVVPRGAFLVDYDRSENGVWIKLWRNMIWSILRGVPATRRPYDERSEGIFTQDADKVWQELNKPSDFTVELPSTYFIGAQAVNAENVPFKDRARFQFLLHFWAFVAQIYVPLTWSFDRKTNRESPKDNGYALVIPDVANLEAFCDKDSGLPEVLRTRETNAFGYRPKESVIDVAAEGALDLMSKLNDQIASKVDWNISDLLLGVDVVHLEKQGNNIRLWGTNRVDPLRPLINEYSRVKSRFTNQLFRRQRMLNVLNERDWYDGFGALLSKTDAEQTIKQSFFQSDVRKAFEDIGVEIKRKGENINMTETQEAAAPKTVEALIYQLVDTFIRAKLKSKYQLEWKKIQGTGQEPEYQDKKAKIAREAFLAIRSRTGEDFIEYFASTLCAFPQFLSEAGYGTLAKELYEDTDKVRTLTMLALSARG